MHRLVLPFGLPAPEMARDLIASLRTPALARLLACASADGERQFDGFSPALPHEIWLAEHSGSHTGNAEGVFARYPTGRMAGYWFIVSPVHFHIARDHLVLTEQTQLQLTPDHARALFQTAEALFAELGLCLHYADANTWLLHANPWRDLQCATLGAATGHNIDIWLPKGASARAFRKLQNEVQMAWYEHPANQQRAAMGRQPVNSIWLWGGAELGEQAPQPSPTPSMTLLDTLTGPALRGDWAAWLDAYAAIDHEVLTPLLARKPPEPANWPLHIVLTNSQTVRQWRCSRLALLAWWRQSGMHKLQFPALP